MSMDTFKNNNSYLNYDLIKHYEDERHLFNAVFITCDNSIYDDPGRFINSIIILDNHLILDFSGMPMDASIDPYKIKYIDFDKFNRCGESIEHTRFVICEVVDESIDRYGYDMVLYEPIRQTIIFKYKK